MRYIFIIIGVLLVVLTIASMLIWVERRLLALWQDRLGPNRVGPFGLLQVVADMIKIFFKEDWTPPFADKDNAFPSESKILHNIMYFRQGNAFTRSSI